jgi:1-acyl-sn-glycerol-3-phosphate acyltransferase
VPIVELIIWLVALVAALVLFGFVSRALCNNERNDPTYGMVFNGFRLYMRLMHRPTYAGIDNIPPADGTPTIFVCNHTAGVDPVLVHLASRHDTRWMMASDMRAPKYEAFWNWMRIIDVDRTNGDPASAREALRHLAQGGTVGIFPEGGLERPPKQLIEFMPGVGLLIKKSRARVVPVFIDDTPQVDPAFASLWHRSNSRVTFYPPINYSESGMTAKGITQDLFDRYKEWSGWPTNKNPKFLLEEVA